MRLSPNLAGASTALSYRSHRPTHGKQRERSGRSLASLGLSGRASRWDFLDTWAWACLRRGRKVHGRWTEGGQRTPVSMSSSKRPPRRVGQQSSGFSAGSQRVSRRCSEGAPFVGSPANGSTWTRFRPVPAQRLTCGAPTAPTATRVRARGVSPIPEFGGLP
jgi:hypothetical protein